MDGGFLVDKTKLMLNSTQVEDVLKVGVELGNILNRQHTGIP